jgi:hypothetical protein
LNDPGSTEPEDLLTDIYAPIEPQSVARRPKSKTNKTFRK